MTDIQDYEYLFTGVRVAAYFLVTKQPAGLHPDILISHFFIPFLDRFRTRETRHRVCCTGTSLLKAFRLCTCAVDWYLEYDAVY